MEGNSNCVQIFATFLFLIKLFLTCLSAAAAITTTDQSALLSLKSKITSDPHNSIIMQNWTAASPVCSWIGVTCGNRHHRVSYLNISYMGLTGEIPPQLGNLTFLISLDMKGNNFFGLIPEDLSRLRRLRFLNMSGNSFSGEVPSWFASLHQLESLDMHNNSFTSLDSFLVSSSNESKLATLSVSFNRLQGNFPELIGNLRGLRKLLMYGNKLSGFLPSSLANLTSLTLIDMGVNFIEGSLPEWMGNFRNLNYLNFESNRLIGSIPSSIFNISTLEILALSQNKLSNTLPADMCLRLPLLTGLYLAGNELYGEIPSNISLCSKLQVISLSFNNISGEIPHALGVLGGLEILGLGPNRLTGSVPINIYNITSLRIISLVGNWLSGDLPSKLGYFLPNLEEVYVGSCTNEEFKAIVFEYMQNGSLEKCLYYENQSLDIKQRLDVMIDVASALEYLHHGYSKPVVHCDLKPENVLLDQEMVARISDFGVTKFLKEGESMTHTMTLATLGYMAPEYGSEGIVSTRCDVYSYGIMLLETFTGKRPSDEMFSRDITLRDWVKGSMPDEVIRVVDVNLITLEGEEESFDEKKLLQHCIFSILELGLKCSANSPGERILNMKDVAAQLTKIRNQLVSAS